MAPIAPARPPVNAAMEQKEETKTPYNPVELKRRWEFKSIPNLQLFFGVFKINLRGTTLFHVKQSLNDHG